MRRPSGYDVVVVGARCAGAATAMLLARRGLRVLMVDRAAYGSDTLSTHALMRTGVALLERWGILDAVVAGGTPPVRRTTFHYPSESVTVAIKPSGGVDALYAPRRHRLDALLVDAATGAGVTARFGVSVTDVVRDGTGRVCGIVGRDATGEPVEASARFVVGADGARSLVARRVGAPTTRIGTAATNVVYGYWSDVDADGYEWSYRDRAAAGIIPTDGGEVCVFVAGSTPPSAGGTAGRERWLRRTLERAAPAAVDRLSGQPTGPLRAHPGVPGWMRAPAGPGWVLVGDAGAYRDPITAHGMTDALRDAESAAAALVDALDASDAAAEQESLARYTAIRDAAATPVFDVTDRIARLDWDESTIRRLHLDLSAAFSAETELVGGSASVGQQASRV